MYLKIIVASVFWVLSVSVGGIVACGQELPRADGPAGQTIPAEEFTLYYKKASSVLDGQYRNNQATMEEMASLFAGRDSGDSLHITVYCSIEDTYQRNALLAERRGRAFLDYLDRQYNVSERYKIRIENVPEDWAGLRRRVEASQMPFRSEVLEVMDRVGVFDGREKILMDLAGGRPYKYMYKTMFPELRRVTVRVGRNRVMADTEKEGPLQSSGKITWPEKDTCVCPETGQTERYCAGTGPRERSAKGRTPPGCRGRRGDHRLGCGSRRRYGYRTQITEQINAK